MYIKTNYLVTSERLTDAFTMPAAEAAALSAELLQTYQPVRAFYQLTRAWLRFTCETGTDQGFDVKRAAYELGVVLTSEEQAGAGIDYKVAPYCIMAEDQVAVRGVALWLPLTGN